MDRIAQYLITGGLAIEEFTTLLKTSQLKRASEYQEELISITPDQITSEFEQRFFSDFVEQTLADMNTEDVLQGTQALGKSHRLRQNKTQFISDAITGAMTFNIENRPKPETDDPLLKPIVDRIKSDIVDRFYRCKVRIGASGNVYIFRDINF